MLDLDLVLILVAPAPGRVRSVSRSLHSPLDDLVRNRLQIVRPADLGEEIDESGREVQPVVAQFGRLVVPGEHVMVVVPALAESECGHRLVLRGVDSAVIGAVSPLVSSAVHQPGGIQDERPAEQRGNEPCVGPGFSPEVDRSHSWQDEAQ